MHREKFVIFITNSLCILYDKKKLLYMKQNNIYFNWKIIKVYANFSIYSCDYYDIL
jgi:hypothetical protein